MFLNKLKSAINHVLRESLGFEIRRVSPDRPNAMSMSDRKWRYEIVDGYSIGGRLPVSNISRGYHGLLQQWWEYYNKGTTCLLVSENNKVKQEFENRYPDWRFFTLDLYDNQGESVDISADLCGDLLTEVQVRFDLIICQATLEHVYAPFAAIRNMVNLLNRGGVVVIHTHTPTFPYHAYPRDYFRYHLDWFEDIHQNISDVKLLELYAIKGHVFVAYTRA